MRDREGAVGAIKSTGVQRDHIVHLWPRPGDIGTGANRQNARAEMVAPRGCTYSVGGTASSRGERKGVSLVGELDGRCTCQSWMKHRPTRKRKRFIIHIICRGLVITGCTASQGQHTC